MINHHIPHHFEDAHWDRIPHLFKTTQVKSISHGNVGHIVIFLEIPQNIYRFEMVKPSPIYIARFLSIPIEI